MIRTKNVHSYREVLLLVVLFVTLASVSIGCTSETTPPEEEWNTTFGGTGDEVALAVQQTLDGGYIIAGYTNSYGASKDVLLVKTDSNGNKLWNKTFGGTADDVAAAILPVSGGGYIIAGYTDSCGAGNDDVWLIKTDSNGTEIWNKTFGGTGDDNACSVRRTLDDGCIIAGFTDSYGAGNDDVWLIKTDSNGTEIWNETFGGLYSDLAYSAQQTTDGSYIIAGCTYSFGAGEEDFWLVKTDSNGTEIWNETFGGNRFEFAKSVQQTSDGGYIIAGYTDSFGAGKGDVLLVKADANGTEIWNTTFGGTETDSALSVQQTIDNGYIIAGSTKSYGAGLYDAWIVKTNANGTEIWNKTFGGNSWDAVTSIKQAIDGGYILAGYTYSYGAGSSDLWLIRVKGEAINQPPTALFISTPTCPVVNQTLTFDASSSYDPNGNITNYDWDFGDGNTTNTTEKIITHSYALRGDYNVNLTVTDIEGAMNSASKVITVLKSAPPEEEWNKTFGGTDDDGARSVQQTTDGGYILAGYTKSYGAGNYDFWLVKSASNGSEQWNKSFGGPEWDVAMAVQQTSEGGYILAGHTASYGAGRRDVWLVKTDSKGKNEWDKTFGGPSYDCAHSIEQTSEGGYIFVGRTDSYGAGESDIWLVKTDSKGKKEWSKTFGGTGYDYAHSVKQTVDDGYILVGYTQSYGAGSQDFWLVKTDSKGDKEWSKTFGGTLSDEAWSVEQTAEGGYILAGFTQSYGAGSCDFWLVKTDSKGDKEWDKTFGGTDPDWAWSVEQTADGGYILAGRTDSYGAGDSDFWLVKTDSKGDREWDKTFGGPDGDVAWSVEQTADGGYILAGYTYSYGAGSDDIWLIRVKGESTELSVHNIDTGKNFLTIQAAIEDPSTENGHTIIVDAGTYYENVNVTKRLILMGVDTGSGKPVVDAGGNGSAITLSADGITLKGFNATNSRIGAGAGAGIKVNSSYNNITGNIASNNHYGIYLDDSCNNNITGNTASNNIGDGILLYFSCNNNTITGNKGCNNSIYGSIFPYCGIHLYSSSNNTITGNSLSNNNDRGIRLWSSSNNTITGNNVSNNRDGITLWYICTYNTITGNNVRNNNEGISLFHSSNNNSVIDNNVSNNSYGISLSDSSSNNAVTSNNISNNGGGIIFCHSSNNNTVTGNKVRNNDYYGIYLPLSDSNNIYLNNFINNTDNVYSYNSTNIWNATKEIIYTYNGSTYTNYMGNYWSNYTGTDANSDGIWDNPYSIDSDKDYHPLVEPFENYLAPTENICDTGPGTYPSISGTHNGTIKPTNNILVHTLYTYSCPGTGGHTEYVKIWNSSWKGVEARWNGYQGDWKTISFNKSFILYSGKTYNYCIRTGSYPQIIHESSKEVTGGTINCTEFVDTNGKKYNNRIPAIRFFSEVQLTAADNGTQIELKKGQSLRITLESYPTTGYTWYLVELPNEHILRQVGEIEFKQESDLVGAGGVQIIRFDGVSTGQTALKLVYHRPWETDVAPEKIFYIHVVVNG